MSGDLKLVLVGHKYVGKTSLFNRHLYQEFTDDTEMTLGAYFANKDYSIDGILQKVYIWDTAGQEKFNSLVSHYCRGAQAALICYDLTNRESFDALEHWVSKILNEAEADCVISLVGTKFDLVESGEVSRKINTEESKQYASEKNAVVYEVSSKTGYGVDDAFADTVRRVIQSSHFRHRIDDDVIKMGSGKQRDDEDDSCC